jgi:hypothetical protein
MKTPKIFKKDDMIIGCTGYPRMGQLIQYALKVPVYREAEQDLFSYMATTFIDALRQCFRAAGYAEISNNKESVDSVMMIGYKKRLFVIESNYQVIECTDDYYAIGCGEEVALGALAATAGEPPQQRVEKALLAAEKYSPGVRGPFNYLKMDKRGNNYGSRVEFT